MQNLSDISNIVNMVLIFVGIIAGLWTLRRSVVKATNEIHQNAIEMQQNAIDAMREEINSLKSKLDDASREIKRLNTLLRTISKVAKNRGFSIEVEEDIIYVRDTTGTTSVIHIQEER